ncbi:hypothetical protein ACFVAV_04900 [Nocardia sp. NPDC057663]|uniref:hypothetical protein n=1 Tax=Nocardia sp. NPDC057663 TaxID=3346201 RepID=UPI00366DA769
MSTENGNEQFGDAAEVVAEIDSLIRDQAELRQRAKQLHAKLVDLRMNGDQFFNGWDSEAEAFVHSGVRIEWAGRNLGTWIKWSLQNEASLDLARDCAAQVRNAPRQAQETAAGESSNAVAEAIARAAERAGVER